MEFMMFFYMNKNLIDFFINIFLEMSEVDIFILKIVIDLKKKSFYVKKKVRKNLKINYWNCVVVKILKYWYIYDVMIVIVLYYRLIYIVRKCLIKLIL